MVSGQKQLLTAMELLEVHHFIRNFKKHIGADNKITESIIEMHYRNIGKKINNARIRAIANHIRTTEKIEIGSKKYFLVSDDTSYWLTCDKEEIARFIESLDQQIETISLVKEAAKGLIGIAREKGFNEENQGKLF